MSPPVGDTLSLKRQVVVPACGGSGAEAEALRLGAAYYMDNAYDLETRINVPGVIKELGVTAGVDSGLRPTVGADLPRGSPPTRARAGP